jgi:hypothetical protein
MMNTDTILDFVSRECKNRWHQDCFGKWDGLGFEIICSCICGHKTKSQEVNT